MHHALTLLRHTAIDVRLKDAEGLSAFDLYNSTVSGTNPAPPNLLADSSVRGNASPGDLYLWGSNRNYTLGLGDGNDRALPDSVSLKRPAIEGTETQTSYTLPAGRQFDRITVKDVQMSKMHTVVVTNETSGGNVWVAGIGSNGRLGRNASTQPTLTPLADFKETAASVAVGPDHTLIITTSGNLYSFGLNKFGVLGYTVESGQGLVASSGTGSGSGSGGQSTSSSAKILDVQITPRKIVGPLKREEILGAAVSKLHSVAFSTDALYTWGSNTGQLGYDKTATPLQIQPRKVTSVTSQVRQVACTDHATALLLSTFDVLVYHGDLNFRLQFPMTRFSEKMSVFRPRQAQPKPSIAKITSSGSTFAALSDYGDLFTFSLGHPSEYATGSSVSSTATKRIPAPEPQLVWSVRKKFTAVRDVAISLDGSIVLCTSSGHVFVRSRRSGEAASAAKPSAKTGSARAFKFAQIPLLQRVIKVATNESGGFAAIRGHPPVKDIRIKGHTLAEDMSRSLPFLRISSDRNGFSDNKDSHITADIGLDVLDDEKEQAITSDSEEEGDDSDDERGDSTIQRHSAIASLLAEAARRWDSAQEKYGPKALDPPTGCDMFIIAGGKYLPAHRAIVAARIQTIRHLLEHSPDKGLGGSLEGVVIKRPRPDVTTMLLPQCSFHTGLFLLYYLYTDDLPAIWTASVGMRADRQLSLAKVNRSTVQSQLKELASILALPALTPCLNSPVPRTPTPTLCTDLRSFFNSSVDCAVAASPLHDIELRLSDRTVPTHSVILRRSPFFSALLQPDWSSSRWLNGKIAIDLSHLRWDVLGVHLQYLYGDAASGEVLDGKDKGMTQDEWIDYLTEILGASNELLLDRLKLICSSLLRARTSPTNIAALLTIADTFYALPLKEASLLYCAQNLESLLEGGMLDDLEHRMIRDLAQFVKKKQDDRLHKSLQSDFLSALMLKHQDYCDSLDIPPPSLNLSCYKIGKRPPLPASSSRKGLRTPASPLASPELRPAVSQDSALFDMDEEFASSPSLGAVADRSLQSQRLQADAFQLPKALEGKPAAAPWSSKRSQSDLAVAKAKQASAGAAGSSDLRSIMAAERNRASTSTPLPTVRSSALPARGSNTSSGMTTPLRPPGTPVNADASGSGTSDVPDLSALSIAPKLSQKERKKLVQQQMMASTSQDPTPQEGILSTTPSKGSPWKVVETPPSLRGSAVPNEGVSPNANRTPLRTVPTGGADQRTPSGSFPSPHLGPTFTPVKVTAPSLSRSTSEAVWTRAGATPPPAQRASTSGRSHSTSQHPAVSRASVAPLSPSPSPSTTGMTFAEIQAQQVAAAIASEAMTPQKKSFAEIQAEDRQAELDRLRAEKERLEFEKWFEEESRRVKAEEKAASRQAGGGGSGKEGKKKGRGSNANRPGDEGTGGQGAPVKGDSSTPKPQNQAPPKGPKRSSENHGRGGGHPDRGGREGGSARGGRGGGSSSRGGGGGGGGGGGRGGKGIAHPVSETPGPSIANGATSSSQPRPAEPAMLSAAAPSFQPSAPSSGR